MKREFLTFNLKLTKLQRMFVAIGGGLVIVVGAAAIVFNVLAAGPFTITPNSGPAEGGNEITLTGSGFLTGAEAPYVVKTVAQQGVATSTSTYGGGLFVLYSDGSLYANGENSNYQLGQANTTDTSYFVKVRDNNIASGCKLIDVSAGQIHVAAVDDCGNVYTWGDGGTNALGTGATTDVQLPTRVTNLPALDSGDKFVSVHAGYQHTWIISDFGRVYVVGNGGTNYWFRGTATATGNITTFTASGARIDERFSLNSGEKIVKVTSGMTTSSASIYSLFLTNQGRVFGTGYNRYGNVGTGSTTGSSNGYNITAPTLAAEINGMGTITDIDQGMYHTVALTSTGKVITGGTGPYYGATCNNSTGTGTTTRVQFTTEITQGSNNNALPGGNVGNLGIAAVQAGSLILSSNGTIYACGRGGAYGTGYGTTTGSTYRISTVQFDKIAGGALNGYAYGDNFYSWGEGGGGQILRATTGTGDSTTPLAYNGSLPIAPVPKPSVVINGKTCEVGDYSDTSITCTVPSGDVGRADVTVTPSGGGAAQTYYGGYEYRGSTFDYDIMNTGVNPYTYAVNPDTLRAILPYDHASLITISYPRTASDGSTTVMTNSVTMANSTMRTASGGQCGGVACNTATVSITGNAANVDGSNGLIEFLKGLEWSGNAGYLRGEIRITIMPENVEFWIDGDGNRHFYELVNSGNSSLTWSQAYNLASQRTFHGLKGYLISMTEKAEADIILQYTQNSGLSAVGYTSGIRFRNNDAEHTKVDATIGYAGNPITAMPDMPAGQGNISSAGFACTATTSSMQSQGCTSTVAAITSSATDACPSAAAYDTQWYWANPADNGKEFYSGRVYTECSGNPLKNTDLTSYWNGAQPQGGEFILAYSSTSGSFGWHDYSNNAGSYYYVEYSEGWFDSGTYDTGEVTFWSAPIPLEITIHHVRANTGERLAPDTKAPSMGLNTTTNQFQCSAANGGKAIEGYSWQSSSCTNGQFPYDPSSATQEITYTYAHNSVPNPVPFRMERTINGSNYVYKMYGGDSGTAVDDFGAIRQVVVTYPSELTFASVPPGGWTVDSSTPGRAVINMVQEFGVTATEVQNYLYTVTLTASGLTNVTGSVTVEVADYPNVPATGDPGRTSSSSTLPQPVSYHYYRLGHTNDLIPGSETIGLVNQSFSLTAPPQYLPLGSTAETAEYEFYQASPAVGTLITYRGTPTDVYYYYQPVNGLTVSFSMNGESATESIPDQSVPNGDNAVRPPIDPVVLGKRFTGWYQTNTCAAAFDFENTPITSDQTIYACFESASEMSVVFDESSPSGTPEVSTNPTQIDNITFNDLISAPTPPILPGYAFGSWNTQPMIDSTTCSGNPWDFATDRVNAPVGTNQITLYVCWEPRSNVTMNFNTATNAPATVQVLPNPSSRSVPYNGTTTPPTSPVSEGYAFINWRTEPMSSATTCGGAVFDFNNTRLTAAATNAYACWEKRADLSITFSKGDKEGDPNIQGWPTTVNDMPYNSAAAAYQPEVTLEGWRLSHWCETSNPNCTRNERFDWSQRRTANISLVAIWREDVMAIDEIVPEYGSTTGGYRVTVYGSGFLAYDANSYAKNGLMVLLDGENNAGSLSAPSHNASATTWNNLAPAAAAAFGNFALSGVTVNANSLYFDGNSSRAKSGSTATLNTSVGGTTIAQVTTEVAYKQNAAGSNYSQLYEYGPIGYGNTAANGSFGEVLNASALSSASPGNCYIGQRTSASAFTGGSGACANNTISTTHTSIQSKDTNTPRKLIIDGNSSSPAVNATNSANSFINAQSVVIGARTTNSGQSNFANFANISVNSFRMYNRTLTDSEIRCNYLVDLARFQGIFDSGLSACGSQLQAIVPDAVEINGEACTNVTVSNESQLTCTVPASTIEGDDETPPYREGTVDAYIKIGAKEATLEDAFTYQAPLSVFSVSPVAGPVTGGDTITITGTDFRDLAVTPAGVPEVSIGANVCENVVLSADFHSLTCMVPPSTHGTGPVDVTVTIPNRNQSAVIVGGYSYFSTMRITDVSPNAGGVDGGTEITISGDGFGDIGMNYSVVLDYDSDPSVCMITDRTDTTITCTTTAHGDPGAVDVMVSNGIASVTSVAAFTYTGVAESYVNVCYDEASDEWVNGETHYIFMEQGASADCRLTFDAPFAGTLSLFDDYKTTIDPTLSGRFSSADSRYSNGVFTLAYDDEDVTTPTTGQVLNYTYTAPTASILEQYYDGSDTSAGYVGNGYDLYWPALAIENSGGLLPSDDNVVVFGLTAQKYWLYPSGANTIYVVNSEGSFTVSTHGAYFPGEIAFSDDLTYSDNPSGTPGVFGAGGVSPNNVVDLSDLEGADSSLSYLPKTSATGLNYIRINGASDPSITNTYYDIKVTDSCLSVSGPMSMSRGETAEFTLTASCGENWSGSVVLSDPFNSSGEVGGAFADTSTGANPSGTFNAGTKTYSFTAGAGESYERTFNWTMRDDSITPPTFPSYIVYITVDDGAGASYTPVMVNANSLRFACAAGYSGCTTAYVGNLFDIAISPNGMFVGKAQVTSDGGGSLGNNGLATWSASDSYVMSVTPNTPGRKTLTATITNSDNVNLPVGATFLSSAANSFNDYIWVMANSTTLSGSDKAMSGRPETYTLTLNGPFEGTVLLSDVLEGTSTSAGGTFSANQCTFNKSNYDAGSNTTSCTFTYTPATFVENTRITLRADKQASYSQNLASSTLNVNVHASATISEICRVGTGGDSGVACDSSGTFAGGDEIVIYGNNFIPYTEDEPDVIVTFDPGGVPATCASATVVDNNHITCTTPAHGVGVVDVTINNGEETAVSVGGFTFQPELTAVSPSSGYTTGGETVTVSGGGFISGETTVSIGGNVCSNLQFVNSGTVTCVVPASTLSGDGDGVVDVVAKVNDIAAPTLDDGYTYKLALAVTGVTPKIGPSSGGNQITVSGVGFVSGQTTLQIEGQQCTNLVVQSDEQLTCTVPASNLPGNGEGTVSAKVSDGVNPSHILEEAYTYREPMLASVAAPNPVPIAGGTTFSIVGYNFNPPSSYTGGGPTTVTFISNPGGTRLSCTNVAVVNNRLITCTTPVASVGTYNVEINNGYETAVLTGVLTYAPNPMIVTDIEPSFGLVEGGNSVTITGSGFGENRITNSDYTQLEYLDFTGGQYIDSGQNQTGGDVRVEIDFQYNASGVSATSNLFGARATTTASWFAFYKYNASSYRDAYNATSGSNLSITDYCPMGARCQLTKNNGTTFMELNGVTNTLSTYANVNLATARNIYIGAINENNTVSAAGSGFQGKMWSYKLYKAGTLTQNMVPACRNADSVGGMYDLVNNVFYPSNRSGTPFSCSDIPVIAAEVEIGGNVCTEATIRSDTEITCNVPASTLGGDGTGTVDAYVGIGSQNNTLVGAYTYFKEATGYTNECREGPDEAWTTQPYVEQGETIECRIVLDNPFEGTLSLTDDYRDTINPLLSGVFESGDNRFANGGFTLTYADTLDEDDRVLYYNYTSPDSQTLDSYYDQYNDPINCDERCDNGYDLYWPALSVTGNLANTSGALVVGLLAETYDIFPSSEYGSYCVDCVVGFTLSTRGAPYLGTISLADDLTNSDNVSGASGVFSSATLDLSDLDGGDANFEYTPKTPATNSNYLRIYGTSADPPITDGHFDMTPVYQSTLTITGPSALKRGESGTFTLTVVDAGSWSGTVALSDIFSAGGTAAGGTFADLTGDGSYDPVTNSYTFTSGGGETYERTFSYTLRDDEVSGDPFPSYVIRLVGSNGTSSGYSNVSILANDLSTRCSANYPNCTTAYVGESKDLSLSPNGVLDGTGQTTDHSGGQITRGGATTWAGADPFVISYSPASPGHKTITTTIASQTNSDMDGESYDSTAANSLNSYIYVMANRMTLTGQSPLLGGATAEYTLTMNGPFVGTINFSDIYSNGSLPANGVFSNTSCTFDLQDYVYTDNNEALGTGTTTCTFDYTPDIVSTNQTVRINAVVDGSYPHEMILTPVNIVVRTPMTVSGVSPSISSNVGGDTITLTGNNMNSVTGVTIGGEACSNLTISSATQATCTIPEYNGTGLVDVVITGSDGEVLSLKDGFEYYAPLAITGISPDVGPSEGGTLVNITGIGFIAPGGDVDDVSVWFDGSECTIDDPVNDVTDSSIACTTSGHNAGIVSVVVDNSNEDAELVAGFTYIESMGIETICQVGTGPTANDNPACRPYGLSEGGTEVVITGNSFIAPNDDGSATTVTLGYGEAGAAQCQVSSITNDTIHCTTGAHAGGTVNVWVDNGFDSAEMPAEPSATPSDPPVSGYLYTETYISMSSGLISYEVGVSNPENYSFDIERISTSNPTGYSLSLLSNGSNLVCSTDSAEVIPSIANDGQLTNEPNSTWGYNVVTPTGSWTGGVPDAPTSWKVIPATDPDLLFSSPDPAPIGEEDEFGLYFGTKITPQQHPCIYRQTLTLTVVAN